MFDAALLNTIAAVDVAVMGAMVVAFGLVVVLPVVAIMAEHQRKMARIMRGETNLEREEDLNQVIIGVGAVKSEKNDRQSSANKELLDEIRALRGELADLRMQVASLPGSNVPPIPRDDAVRERLSQNQ
jgi:hypothetical protein